MTYYVPFSFGREHSHGCPNCHHFVTRTGPIRSKTDRHKSLPSVINPSNTYIIFLVGINHFCKKFLRIVFFVGNILLRQQISILGGFKLVERSYEQELDISRRGVQFLGLE